MAAAVDMEALFGEMSDDEEAPKQQAAAGGAEGGQEEEDNAEERPDKKKRGERQRTGPPLHVELPVPAAKMGSADTMMMRLSNIVTVKHKPFDPESHAVEGEIVRDAAGNEQFKSLDLNVIRWRFGRNELGEETVESNARLVRFSDGSVQLEIGDEVLKVAEADMAADNDFLTVQHAGGLLECKAHLRRKLVCRPSSLNSKSHRLLTRHLDRRHVKVTRVKRTVTTVDPEFELEAKIKAIEKDQRNMAAMRRKQERIEMRHAAQPRGRRASPSRDRDDLNAQFLEARPQISSDDDDDRPAKKASAGGKKGGKKRERYADSDEDSAEDSDQSYSEEEEKPRAKAKKKMPPGSKIIESDSD